MASTYAKNGTGPLYARIKKTPKKWGAEKTPYVVGQEVLAQRYADELQRLYDGKAEAAGEPSREISVRSFAKEWIAGRRKSGLRSVNDDESRLELHILPALGELRLDQVRPKNIRDLVKSLRASKTLAPRTIRNIYGVTRTMFHDAWADELIPENPCRLKKGALPKKRDANPAWRATAIFTREELVEILASPALLADRRVLYGLKALAGMRHSEAAKLTWSQIDPRVKPLGKISLAETKTDVPREIPIHPALAALLESWLATGWRDTFGRKPELGDLVVPTRNGTARAAAQAQKDFLVDLERLELRRRRGHDLRRSFISLARGDGARADVLEVVTHGPKGDIYSLYTTWGWADLCAEVAKLRISLARAKPKRALATSLATRSDKARKRWAKDWRPQRDSNPVPALGPHPEAEQLRGVEVSVDAVRAGLDLDQVARIATAVSRAWRAGEATRALMLATELRDTIAGEIRKRSAG